MTNKVNIEAKNTLARLMATENITVQHKKVQTASFDVKNRVLNLPIWEDMSNVLYEGLIGHEVGHALYTPFEEWKEFVKENPNLKDYANVIEDARIERLMKVKYAGMNKTFFGMYDELNMKDFFGLRGRDMDEFGILDRINLRFKLGSRAEVTFTEEEARIVDKVASTKTFQDVLDLTLELAEYAKNEELNTDFDNMEFSDSDEDFDIDDFEESDGGSNASPRPSPKDNNEDGEGGAGDEEDEDGEDGEDGKSGSGNDSDEDGEDGNGDGSGKTDQPPASETQKNFDDRLGEMNDENASNPIYVDLPNIDLKNTVIGYKNVGSVLNEFYGRSVNYDYWGDNGEIFKKKTDDQIVAWKKDTLPVVNYMVKEFEMKQAATAHRRTSVGKTGVLDTNKMHAYKYEEDIFKRVATVKDGRNHALVMYVDWSGSMADKILGTVKQTITLAMFARKVGIPFRVYAFTNSSGIGDYKPNKTRFYQTEDNGNFAFDHLELGRMTLVEFFNEKMNAREFNDGIINFYKLGLSVSYSRYDSIQTPIGFGLASTPLNECIIASYEQVENFKRECGKEKVNVIFLTDGDSDGNDRYYSVDETCTKYPTRWGEGRSHLAIRDPKTKKIVSAVTDEYNRNGMTQSLLTALGERCKVNVIGFFLTDKRTIKYAIERNFKWEEGAVVKKKLTKNGYVSMASEGYDKYFMVNDRVMDKEVEMPDEVARKDDGSVNKGKLRTAFKKFSKGRKVNKMLLNEFVQMVA